MRLEATTGGDLNAEADIGPTRWHGRTLVSVRPLADQETARRHVPGGSSSSMSRPRRSAGTRSSSLKVPMAQLHPPALPSTRKSPASSCSAAPVTSIRFGSPCRLPSATPPERFFGFCHVLDGGWNSTHYCRSWEMLVLHKFGPLTDVERRHLPGVHRHARTVPGGGDVGEPEFPGPHGRGASPLRL